MKQKIIIISVILIIIFLAGTVFMFFSERINKVDISEDAYFVFDSNQVNGKVNLENKGSEAVNLNVVMASFTQTPEDMPIYFYYDNSYPVLVTSSNAYIGLYNFLTSDFAEKGIQKKIELIDATALAEKMQQGKSIVIMSSGVLPDTVYSKDKNIVTGWLESGGIMFWVGDGIGYYYGAKNMVIKDDDEHGKIGWEGHLKLLGKNYIYGETFEPINQSQGDIETQVGRALGLRYRYTTTGATLNDLAKNNGADIGFDKRINSQFGRSSISFMPVGDGRLILFGSGILEKQRDVSWDISQIISSNLIFTGYPTVKYEEVNLLPKSKKVIDLQITQKDVRGTTLLIFNKDNQIKYFYSKVFNNSLSPKSNLTI